MRKIIDIIIKEAKWIKDSKYEWFYDMPKLQQIKYLKDHPDSSIAKRMKERNENNSGFGKLKQKIKEKIQDIIPNKKEKEESEESKSWKEERYMKR